MVDPKSIGLHLGPFWAHFGWSREPDGPKNSFCYILVPRYVRDMILVSKSCFFEVLNSFLTSKLRQYLLLGVLSEP